MAALKVARAIAKLQTVPCAQLRLSVYNIHILNSMHHEVTKCCATFPCDARTAPRLPLRKAMLREALDRRYSLRVV